MDILEELKYRGCLFQTTEGVDKRLAKGPANIYWGVDPTAASMTIGNLVPLVIFRRLQLAGHHPIALVGGGTGLIGDPGGKDAERLLSSYELIAANTASMREELGRFLDFDSKTNPAQMVSNLDWLSELKIIDFLSPSRIMQDLMALADERRLSGMQIGWRSGTQAVSRIRCT